MNSYVSISVKLFMFYQKMFTHVHHKTHNYVVLLEFHELLDAKFGYFIIRFYSLKSCFCVVVVNFIELFFASLRTSCLIFRQWIVWFARICTFFRARGQLHPGFWFVNSSVSISVCLTGPFKSCLQLASMENMRTCLCRADVAVHVL